VVCDRHQHTTGQGHINPTGKGHTTGGVVPKVDNKKYAVVHKDYVLDYTSPLQNVIMETESGDGGLTYRYSYGLQKENVVIYGIPNGAGSLLQKQTYPGGAQNIVKLYYHKDRLGSTDYLTDNIAGKVTSYATYDDFGELTAKAIVKMGVRMLDLVQEYTGHPFDQVLGLYYAKARMYDAQDRRFVAVDPVKGVITIPTTLVQYTYVLDNPIIYVDLLGLAVNPYDLIDWSKVRFITVGGVVRYSAIDIFKQLNGLVTDYSGTTGDVQLTYTYDSKSLILNYNVNNVPKNVFGSKINNRTFTGRLKAIKDRKDMTGAASSRDASLLYNSTTVWIDRETIKSYFQVVWCDSTIIDKQKYVMTYDELQKLSDSLEPFTGEKAFNDYVFTIIRNFCSINGYNWDTLSSTFRIAKGTHTAMAIGFVAGGVLLTWTGVSKVTSTAAALLGLGITLSVPDAGNYRIDIIVTEAVTSIGSGYPYDYYQLVAMNNNWDGDWDGKFVSYSGTLTNIMGPSTESYFI
jgi:RHS repeat-associated protein